MSTYQVSVWDPRTPNNGPVASRTRVSHSMLLICVADMQARHPGMLVSYMDEITGRVVRPSPVGLA